MKKVLALFIALMMLVPAIHTDAGSKISEESVYDMALEIGGKYNICPEFLQAMAFRESSYNPYAKNGDCIGLMQVSQKWHKDRMNRLGVDNLYDPYGNMLVAADYLSELFIEYEDPAIVLHVYNGDNDAFRDYYISDYAEDILNLSMELERENGK